MRVHRVGVLSFDDVPEHDFTNFLGRSRASQVFAL